MPSPLALRENDEREFPFEIKQLALRCAAGVKTAVHGVSRHLRKDLREVPTSLGRRSRPGRGKTRSTAHANRLEARQASEQLDGRNVERFAQRWHADRR